MNSPTPKKTAPKKAAAVKRAPAKKTASAKPADASGGLSTAEIAERMYAKLAGSDLDAEDARIMQLKPATRAQAAVLKLPMAQECFVIPYFDLAGNPSPFYRARLVVDSRKGFDIVAGKKAVRYVQRANSVTEAYFPPMIAWDELASDTERPVIITEGELKAACACKHGFPTIGLGGVWSFQSAKANQELLPIFHEFDWNDRTVYIAYDSDAATNPMVVMAELRLAQRLIELGAHVYITRLPAHEDVQKVGLDDYIVLNGPEALASLLESERTYELDGSRVLHTLNERVVYVQHQMIMWDHKLERRMSPSDFVNHAFSNVHMWRTTVDKNGVESRKKVSAAREWMQWEARAECLGLAFEPGQDRITPQGHLNTWTGWGVDAPIEGDVEPWHHLLQHIFGDDAEARQWFERWAAYPLQNPGAKLATAAAVWGPVHGSGKTLIGHTLMRIYGMKHAAELKDSDLEDDRNEWADGKCFALCDDITARGDRKFMRKLMTMVTQKTIKINPKYIVSYSIEDRINYYYTSNDPDALYMDDNDRRFFIHETRAGKYVEYKRYVAWRDSDEGIAALWHYLLTLDMGDFDPQAPAPASSGKSSMIEVGKSELGAWVLEFRRNTDFILKAAGMSGDLFTAKQLHALYDPMGTKRASPNALSRELKREGFQPACNGTPVRLSSKPGEPSMQCIVWPVRNREKWELASWSEVRDHYEEHNRAVGGGKKF